MFADDEKDENLYHTKSAENLVTPDNFIEKRVPRTDAEWIYFILTKGYQYNYLAGFYQIVNNVIVIISTVTFLVATLPDYWDRNNPALDSLEALSVAFFSCDYILRLITCPIPKWRWMLKPPHIIDLLSIVPYYVELILVASNHGITSVLGLVVIRVLRLFRMLWTFKIARYSKLVPLFVKALVKSRDGFILFVLNVVIMMVCIAGIMFYAEQTVSNFDAISRLWIYNDGTISPFQSIPSTFWWFMSTISTVGYGDAYPRSDLGKAIAVITMIMGILILSVPVAVFSINFTTSWDERADIQRRLNFRKLKFKHSRKQDQEELLKIIETRLQVYSIRMHKQREVFEQLLKEETEIRELMALITKSDKKSSQKISEDWELEEKKKVVND